jgi:hypothetical protein
MKMTPKTNLHLTSRRDFLKLAGAGLASAWALSAASAPVTSWLSAPQSLTQAAFGSSLLRGTSEGQLLHSVDAGQTWQPLASFGAHCAIQGLVTQNGQLFARLEVAGHSFWLVTADAKTWRTLGRERAGLRLAQNSQS